MNVRDHRLDFVKGFLVFVMVLYHAMNYFSNAPPEVYGYLRFVNGAFVFISGYVISAFYRPSNHRDGRATAQRLVTRGFKLLLIFTALNLAISALGLTSYRSVEFGLGRFVSELPDIYLRGDSDSMAFRILAPIAYVLMTAPLLLMVRSRIGQLALVIIILTCALWLSGRNLPHFYFVLIGLAGVIAGRFIAFSDVYRIENPVVLLVAFVALAAVMNVLSGNVATYSVGIFLTLKLVYDFAIGIDPSSRFARVMVLVGQYSLIAYISQIAFLYLLRIGMPEEVQRGALALPLAILLTGLLMVALPICLARLRARYPIADRLYRVVFA